MFLGFFVHYKSKYRATYFPAGKGTKFYSKQTSGRQWNSWQIFQSGKDIWATSWENLFMPYANNKGADQPAQPSDLISTFVFHCLDSIIPPVSISEISSLYLTSAAEKASFSLPWLQTPITGFLVTRLIWDWQSFSMVRRMTKLTDHKKKTKIPESRRWVRLLYLPDDRSAWTYKMNWSKIM